MLCKNISVTVQCTGINYNIMLCLENGEGEMLSLLFPLKWEGLSGGVRRLMNSHSCAIYVATQGMR